MKRPVPSMGFVEFVFLVAAMMATQALAVDAMLPAFPAIIRSLGIADPNHGQWVLTAYMAGLGCGQLFWGVMSDRFGRRPILLSGIGVYIIAALACASTRSFDELLLWRFIHGTAAAAATVCRSMIRDLYCGRAMARVISLTIVVFFIVPILAPSLGQLVLLLEPWPYIFMVLGAAASIVGLWALARLRETLHPEYRLTLDRGHIMSAVRLVLTHHTSIGYALASMALFGSIMAYVGMVQQIFSEVFHQPRWMPPLFAACAVFMAAAAFLNSRIVERLGMRLISHTALLCFIALTTLHTIVAALGVEQLWTFVLLQGVTLSMFSLAASNFGAMALEPVGAVAGIGASLQGFISTFGGALLGALIGHWFNGTTLPLTVGSLICGLVSLVFVLGAEKGRLFRPQHPPPAGALGKNAAMMGH